MQNVGECFVYLILIELLIKFYVYFSLFPRCQWFFCDIVNYCKILKKQKTRKNKKKLSTIKLMYKNETHKFNNKKQQISVTITTTTTNAATSEIIEGEVSS